MKVKQMKTVNKSNLTRSLAVSLNERQAFASLLESSMFTLRISLIFTVVGILVLVDNVSAFPVPMSEVPFQKRLLDAASKYKSWGRVDDEMRWAPHLCRMPNPGQPYVSASQDDATHGQKLYSIYASKRDEYFHFQRDKPVTLGQVIVKESWIPEEITG